MPELVPAPELARVRAASHEQLLTRAASRAHRRPRPAELPHVPSISRLEAALSWAPAPAPAPARARLVRGLASAPAPARARARAPARAPSSSSGSGTGSSTGSGSGSCSFSGSE